MIVRRLLPLCGIAALAGCAGVAARHQFTLTAEQVGDAWNRAESAWRSAEEPDQREAREQSTDPWGAFSYPHFSAATCRWIVPRRKASCRYRVYRGMPRPGRAPPWVEESGELYLDETGWSFTTILYPH